MLIHIAVQILAQVAFYAAFMAVLGYFATLPAYTFVDAGAAVITLSLGHAGDRTSECRRLTPEEIVALPPNMRRPTDCPRSRAPLPVELELDGEILYRTVLPPSGLASDGASSAYEGFVLAPGRHRMTARLRDGHYDEYLDHKTDHMRLLDDIRDLMDDYEDGVYVDVERFGVRLDDWFSEHFRTRDARLHKKLG